VQLALSIRGVSKTYRSGAKSRFLTVPALREVSLDVGAGEIVGVVGRPGSGKSTLLLCLAGLLRIEAGSIAWFGEQVTDHHVPPGIAYVPQRAGYYSFLTIREALEYYATLHDLSTAHRAAHVESAMRDVGLHVHATRRVSSLSSSLLQRLGLAQSLIGSPRAILFDETLCGEGLLFDPEIVYLLTRLARRRVTIILAAPNPVELHRIAARTINIVEGRAITGNRDAVPASGAARYPEAEVPLVAQAHPPRRVAENS
jgi:ABC-2 type transport system ATP-binding protein